MQCNSMQCIGLCNCFTAWQITSVILIKLFFFIIDRFELWSHYISYWKLFIHSSIIALVKISELLDHLAFNQCWSKLKSTDTVHWWTQSSLQQQWWNLLQMFQSVAYVWWVAEILWWVAELWRIISIIDLLWSVSHINKL